MSWPDLEENKPVYRIMSFDPAIGDMGVCVADFDVAARKFRVVYTQTISGPKFLKYYKSLRKSFKDSFCILTAYKKFLTEEFIPQWKPDYIATEGAFFHKFVATLISLTLVNNVIRSSSRDTIGRDIFVVAPMTTKKNTAKRGDAGKGAVAEAVMNHPNIEYGNDFLVWDALTDHEFDAIGHGFSFCVNKWMPDLYPKKDKKKKNK